jgi:predicted amidohydrolase YtcJ
MPKGHSMNDTADLVLRNGSIYYGRGRWERGSIAITDGIITACGPDVDQLEGAAARVVEMSGNSILPGFQDTHVHPLFAGVALLGIDLTTRHSRTGYTELIREYAIAHPELAVLTGAGWYGDVFPGGFPTGEELDAVDDRRPILITSHDAHGVWVNTRALEAAGIDRESPDPLGGRIVRDVDGNATGMLLDTACELLDGIAPSHDEGFLVRALLAAQTRLHSVGVTTWQDAAVGTSPLGEDVFPVYRSLIEQGLLTATVVAAQWWDRESGLEQIPRLVARRDEANGLDGITANTVKIMQDGMVENMTAAMIDPYVTAPPTSDSGTSFIDPKDLKRISIELDALGFDIHYHAVGDRAVRECLDAVEAAIAANGRSAGRHQIAHLDVVHPDDVPRFAALGVIANVQMLWARRDAEILERKLPLLGIAREPHHFPFGSLLAASARLAAGSDWPVSDPNPLWAIHTGVTRTATPEDVHAIGDEALAVPLEPEQALDYGVALDAYTLDAAYANRCELLSGVVRVGSRADLVLFDTDISAGDGLGSATVVETLVRGEAVYRAER